MPKIYKYLPGIAICGFIAVVYLPALPLYFRSDDFEWLSTIYFAWQHPADLFILINAYFRPMVKITYLLLYSVAGTHPLAYNVLTLSLHLVNVWLLYVLLFRFTRKWTLAGMTAFAYGISSFYSQVPLWTAAIPDSLMLVFCLLSMLVLDLTHEQMKLRHHLMVGFLTLGALGTKEPWVLFPLITFSAFWLIRKLSVRQVLRMMTSIWMLWGLYLGVFVGLPMMTGRSSSTGFMQFDWQRMLLKFGSLIVRYCGVYAWSATALWQALLVLAGILGVSYGLWKTRNWLALWGLIWMVLTMGISMPLYYDPSRYNYLPLAGFWIAVVAGGAELAHVLKTRWVRTPFVLSGLIFAGVLAYGSYHVPMIQAEIRDYLYFGEFHKQLVRMYREIQGDIPSTRPILLIDQARQRPLVENVASSCQGHQKLFFVRPRGLWELILFENLANFAGNPRERMVIPAPDADIEARLTQPMTVVIFTDAGFWIAPDESEYRKRMQQLYATHDSLPDNVNMYDIRVTP